jgi:hypothetical protein
MAKMINTNAVDRYDERYKLGYRSTLEGFGFARRDVLEHSVRQPDVSTVRGRGLFCTTLARELSRR